MSEIRNQSPKGESAGRRIHPNVLALGWVSFFTDTASEMILPLLPLFLTSVLGVSKSVLGLIEGVAETTASLLKFLSGWYSDRLQKRKALVVAGYGLSNLVKPLLALTTSWTQVLGIRFLDRVGKGIRTAPRDALIAQSSGTKVRGRSFGFHRAMDTAGAVVGSLVAFLVMAHWVGGYRIVFAAALVPGLVAVGILLAFVREERSGNQAKRQDRSETAGVPKRFGVFLAIIGLFTFSHITYAFYIVRASNLGVSDKLIPIVYLVYNVIYALLAMPVGALSDRYGRRNVLAIGFLANALLLFGFGAANATWQAWALFAFYGLVSAVVETVPRALVSDLVGAGRRGTGYGAYHATVGLLPLPANVLFGALWQAKGAFVAFAVWSGLSLVSLVALLAYKEISD